MARHLQISPKQITEQFGQFLINGHVSAVMNYFLLAAEWNLNFVFIPCLFCSVSLMSAEKSSLPHQKQCKDISFGNTLEDHLLWKHPWGWSVGAWLTGDEAAHLGKINATQNDCAPECDLSVHLSVYIKLLNLISKMLQCLFRTSQAPQATSNHTELFHFPATRENTLRV